MNILITGSNGYIARNLYIELLNNKQVNITRLSRSHDSNTIKSMGTVFYNPLKIDYNKLSLDIARNNIELIIHCASMVSYNSSLENIVEMIESNILLGTLLIQISEELNIKGFINLSSYSQHFISSTNEKFPPSFYSSTKSAFEEILKYYAFNSKCLKVINLTLQHVYGKNDQKRIVFLIFDSLINNKIFELKGSNQIFDFVYIDDVLSAFDIVIKLIMNDYQSLTNYQTWGVGTKKGTTLSALVELIERVTKVSNHIVSKNSPLRLNQFKSIWTDYEYIPGWYPRTLLEDGLKKTYNFLLKNPLHIDESVIKLNR